MKSKIWSLIGILILIFTIISVSGQVDSDSSIPQNERNDYAKDWTDGFEIIPDSGMIKLLTPHLNCNFTIPTVESDDAQIILTNTRLILDKRPNRYTFDFDLSYYDIKNRDSDSITALKPDLIFYIITCNDNVRVLEDRLLYKDMAILLSDPNLTISLSKFNDKQIRVNIQHQNWSKWDRIIDPTVVTINATIFIPCNETGGLKCQDYIGDTLFGFQNITWISSYPATLINDSTLGGYALSFNESGGCCGMPAVSDNIYYGTTEKPNINWSAGSDISWSMNIHTRQNNQDYYLWRQNDYGNVQWEVKIVDGNISIKTDGSCCWDDLNYTIKNNSVINLCIVKDAGNSIKSYVNGTLTSTGSAGTEGYGGGATVGSSDGDEQFNGTINKIRMWINYSLSAQECSDVFNTDLNVSVSADTTPPTINNLINSTTTNQSSFVEWSCSENCNYTSSWFNNTARTSEYLVGTRSNNTLALSHNPQLTGLLNSTAYYINLTVSDVAGNKASNNTFSFTTAANAVQQQFVNEQEGDDAILLGINTSEIWIATVYDSYQVGSSNLTNQFRGRFDKFAIKGNKRWAINYISSGESAITGIFNITPTLYVIQLQDLSSSAITQQVGSLINSTYP